MRPIHPGEILREEFLLPLGMSAYALSQAIHVPATRVNDIVNAKRGKVQLSSVPKSGGTPQTALFYGGIFVVTQQGAVTQLALSEKLAACPTNKGRDAAAAG